MSPLSVKPKRSEKQEYRGTVILCDSAAYYIPVRHEHITAASVGMHCLAPAAFSGFAALMAPPIPQAGRILRGQFIFRKEGLSMYGIMDLENDFVIAVRKFCEKRSLKYEKYKRKADGAENKKHDSERYRRQLASLLNEDGRSLLSMYTDCIISEYSTDCEYFYRMGFSDCRDIYTAMFDPRKSISHNCLYNTDEINAEFLKKLKEEFSEPEFVREDLPKEDQNHDER